MFYGEQDVIREHLLTFVYKFFFFNHSISVTRDICNFESTLKYLKWLN